MPELPDLALYLDALERLVVGHPVERVRIVGPSVLKTADPPISAVEGRRVVSVERVGKRIVLALDGDLFVVIHLMIAGRFHWRAPHAKLSRKTTLAAFDLAHGTLLLTEASSKKRARLHVVQGREAVRAFDAGGIEPLTCTREAFEAALRRENHTLKRAFTDPAIIAGVGNAYSDEILHRARLSPVQWTSRTSGEEMDRLFDATRAVLTEWTERLRAEVGNRFPEKVTAFRPEMAVHGKFGQPCPACGTPVQRIVRRESETNYCPTCQTRGRLLADRALSALMRGDWPETLEELEERKRTG